MTSAPAASGAAPATRRVVAQAVFETRAMLRNGEQLLVAVVLPAMVLVGLTYATFVPLGQGRRIDLAVPGVLGLCVISSAFTGTAIATGFDRRYGVLRLLGVTPLGRGGLLAGKALSVLCVVAVQCVAIGGLGLALGWQPRWAGLPAAALSLLLGTWAFVAIALLLAGTLRAEGVLALWSGWRCSPSAASSSRPPACPPVREGSPACCPPARWATACAPPCWTVRSGLARGCCWRSGPRSRAAWRRGSSAGATDRAAHRGRLVGSRVVASP